MEKAIETSKFRYLDMCIAAPSDRADWIQLKEDITMEVARADRYERTRGKGESDSISTKKVGVANRPVSEPVTNKNPGRCYDFQRGQCMRGDRCKFSHDGNIINPRGTSGAAPADYRNGVKDTQWNAGTPAEGTNKQYNPAPQLTTPNDGQRGSQIAPIPSRSNA